MNFSRGRHREEPEINFIPLIDMLLVILIFLMVTSTYSHFAELHISLPSAAANTPDKQVSQIEVAVDRGGHYFLNRDEAPYQSPQQFSALLRQAAGGNGQTVVVIHADAMATHQSVINLMESARLAGLSRITFATQVPDQ